MKMKLTLVVSLLLALAASSYAATCNYYRSSNSVTCRGVTCNAVSSVRGGKLPLGYYYIGEFRRRGSTPWFNLYKQRNNGRGFWDYHTKIPEESCRGGFGLHPGTRSLGCITVTNRSCFNRLRRVINRYRSRQFTVTECRTCFWGRCLRGQNRISRRRTTDLRVYN